jgi:putative ABC transport system permease protein
VSERVQEIGIRKALGATPADIMWQFLCEASVLSGMGGIIGVGSGVVMAQIASLYIRRLKPMWVSVVSENAVLWALGVSLGVGLVFGIFPARRAARLDAILAIRK